MLHRSSLLFSKFSVDATKDIMYVEDLNNRSYSMVPSKLNLTNGDTINTYKYSLNLTNGAIVQIS